MKTRKRLGVLLGLGALVLAAAMGLGGWLLAKNYVFLGGRPYSIQSETLDLSGVQNLKLEKLTRFPQLKNVDLRGTHITLEDYARQGAVFIQQNYSRSVTVEQIARQTGVSRSYLYRAFQTAFGCSPSEYLTRYRIQRAAQLLRHSALPVGTVATSAGLEDPFYFSRVFRREMGVSPTEYRAGRP